MRPQPPLSWIESCLFPHPGASAAQGAACAPNETRTANEATPPDGGWSGDQLASLLTLARRVPSSVNEQLEVQPGQIRWLKLQPQPTRPVYMLIQRTGPLFAHGWPVVPDVDYASDSDWVLQEDETQEPLHPSTGMVQLWNPMVIPLRSLGGSVNHLGTAAWQAMQAVAGHLGIPRKDPISAPRAVVSVAKLAGIEFVTGAPLDDGSRFMAERRAYRALWERWVEEILNTQLLVAGSGPAHAEEAPARLMNKPGTVPAPKAAAGWRALALVSVAALAFVIAQPAWRSDPDATRVTRGLPSSTGTTIAMEVHLAPTATVSDITAWLTEWGGQLAGGPNESGAITIVVPAEKQAQAMATLGASPLVEKFDLQPGR